MRILFVSPVLPHGPADGDRIRIFNIVKQLKARGHRLYLVSFIRKGEEAHLPALGKYFDAIRTVKISKLQIIWSAFKAIFRMIPLNTGAYESSKMEKAVRLAAREYGAEHVFAYRLRCAQFCEHLDLPKSIDYVDSLALYMKRSLKYESSPFYFLYYLLDMGRVLRCEKSTAAKFDNVFINSEDDREYLAEPNIITAPNGADIPAVRASKKAGFTVGFFGNMNYRPNLDAMFWFARNVWKKPGNFDKNIRLVIAGSGSDKAAPYMKGTNAVLKGFIDRIDAEVASWDASVVPVRFGAGRQNKILQSWANKVPVVATPFTAKGVYGKDGANLLVAETAEDFTRQVLRLKADAKLRAKLKAGGIRTLREHFDWKKTGALISSALEKTTI